MGIPSYFSYVLKNHGKIIKRLNSVKLETLLIDANSFIYDAVHESSDNIHERVYGKIKDLVIKLGVKNVFVAFDGTAPLAKMKQQKQRRYKSYLTKKILKTSNTWNTSAITPGTPFMRQLDLYLKPRFEKDGYKYSGSNEPGEGEHKLFNYLRKHPNKTTVVYGLDADLIMLSLLQVANTPKLYLYRETKHFSYMPNIDEKMDYLFYVHEMACQISEYLYDTPNEIVKAVNNYCLLCFLCGNDFLPHFPSINIRNNGIQYLMETFKEHIGNEDIAIKSNIQWNIIKKLFIVLSQQERELIMMNIEWKKDLKQRVYSKNKEDALNHLPIMDIREEYLIEHYDKYYPFLFGQTDSKSISKNYLTMFEWTWYYYHGICKSQYLCYDFHLAPLFSSLIHSVPCFSGETFVSDDNTPPVNEYTQLAYVLPYEDYSTLLPPAIVETIHKKYPQLCRNNYPIHYDFCKFFWESHVEFNYINIHELDLMNRA
jgi:5'-3' exonuclease